MTAHRDPVLLGRAAERRALDRLLEDARDHRSAVLIVRGEAGVGKTALLDHCARQASGFRIARVTGVESEMELPFAGLHQLCAPLLGRLDALPDTQQAALGVALGVAPGAPPDRFLVALAALSLLAEAGAERPLLCIVDDAQWLDAASAQVLGFVARRLLAEAVALVFAVRDPSDTRELAGLPQLDLGPLPDEDARALLATVIPGRVDERVVGRLVAETRGNPLAILELPRALAATQLPAALGLQTATELPGRIEQSFLRRLEALPDDARMLLLVAAAEPIDDPLLVWGAIERLGISQSTADETEGLLMIGERVAFLHPLVRSAVYRSASPGERRAVHLALAEVTDASAGADRRAWHLAAAAAGPDEAVAAELERSAGRAQARGGLAAAAAFLRRSVALTRDPERRVDRALAAAQACLQAGRFDAAVELLAAAEVHELDELRRARVQLLHAELAYAQDRGSEAPLLLLRAAGTLERLDAGLSRDTYLDAWGAALFAGRLAGDGNLHDVSRAVHRRAPCRHPAASARPPPRRLRARLHRGPPDRGAGVARRGLRVRRPGRLGRGGAALGLAGDRRRRVRLGPRHVPGRLDPRGAARPRRGRAGGARGRRQRPGPGRGAQRRLRGGDLPGRGSRRDHRGHRGERRAVRRARARGAARPRGGGLEADRGDDPRRHPRRPGHRRPVRAVGAGGADEQRRPATTRRSRRRSPRARTPPSCSSPCGR